MSPVTEGSSESPNTCVLGDKEISANTYGRLVSANFEQSVNACVYQYPAIVVAKRRNLGRRVVSQFQREMFSVLLILAFDHLREAHSQLCHERSIRR